MGLRYILGRAGSGKTQTCIGEIKAALEVTRGGPALVYLVPEQATFQAERLLATVHPALVRAQVLSFRRLAWRVLGEVGGAARPELGELGRRMALRGLILRRRPELAVFHRAANRSGFIDRLTTTIAELAQQGLGPAALAGEVERRRRAGQEDALCLKLADLALIYADYLTYLEGRFTDPDGLLALAARALPQSAYFHRAEVWVDGFSGFNPQEYQVLRALLERAARVNVGLCLDPDELVRPARPSDLFYPTRQTHARLCRLASDLGVQVETVALSGPPPRYTAVPAVAHLEAFLFGPGERAGPSTGEIQLVAASNRRAEVEAAARKLVALARDRGYRWRELAVIVRELEPYADVAAGVFGKYRIPVFIDRRRPIPHHPLVELVRSALELVVSDWAAEPVFRVLKTDLVGLDRDEVDLLENYVLAYGLRGRRWLEGGPWRYYQRFALEDELGPSEEEEAYLARINAIRERATAELGRFYRSLRRPGLTVGQVARVLFALLEELHVYEQVSAWRDQALAAGDPDLAQEHEQAYGGVLELLDQLVEALGGQTLPLPELARVVESGLEGLSLGLVPPGLDQVVVGTAERSRHPELRAVLVLGLVDGAFPMRRAEDVIFSDAERDQLQAGGLELGPTARQLQFEEQYLTYVALTRADRYLYLSYPLADEAGRAVAPSPYLARLRRMFGLRPVLVTDEPPGETAEDLDYLAGPVGAAGLLARRLAAARSGRSLGATWVEVYRWLAANRRADLVRAVRSLQHSNAVPPLPPALVRELYGNPVRTSVSRLERFASCPFWHFLGTGLGLRPRRVQAVDAPQTGTFFHACLNLFVRRLLEQGREWAELTWGEAAELVAAIVRELSPRLEGEVLLSSAHYRYLARTMERALRRAVVVMRDHARQSQFRPAALELGFGRPGGLPPLELDLGEGWRLELRGQIDRVDVARSSSAVYLRVIDYKPRSRRLDLHEVYHGLALQLLAYLAVAYDNAAVLTGAAAEPAAVFYAGLSEPMLSTAGPLPDEEVERQLRRRFRLQGFCRDDRDVLSLLDAALAPGGSSEVVPVELRQDGTCSRRSSVLDETRFDLLLRFIRHRLRTLGRRLVRGESKPHPYRRHTERACRWCEYAGTCGFDVLLPGNEYRQLRPRPEDELWQQIVAEVELGGASGVT